MPDYKQLYLDLFRANEKALRILVQAQQQAERQLLEDDAPPLLIRNRIVPSALAPGIEPARQKDKPQTLD